MRSIIKNKKGQMGIIIFFGILFVILILGLVIGLVIALTNWTTETITPALEGIGMVENTNVSQAVTDTLGNVNSMVQTLTWMGGVIFVLAIVTCALFVAFAGESTPPIFMGLFFGFLILLIFLSIFVSNAYEDLYNGNDEIASRLQEQTILSYMLLYSPLILTVIAILTGVFIFVKNTGGGGFGQ